MIILADSTYELQVVLGASASGSPPQECHCVVSYRETTDVTYAFKSAQEFTDGMTDVIILLGSSTAGASLVIDHISIYNPDTTGTATVTVSLWNGTDAFILVKQGLTVNETLTYDDKGGWSIN